jgi:xanthine dehydrogenase YagS FAD-binding subunit
MKTFEYVRATDVPTALAAIQEPGAKFLGGGTNLVDLMRVGIERPDTVVDITRLPLTTVEVTQTGGVRIGAMVRNSHLAAHPLIRTRYPVLAQAILTGASGQIRNMATVGGNLLQRTRCHYFYDQTTACNKREPGSGCAALAGFNRNHAILGTSDSCIAVHPSDMSVALTALDAVIEVESTRGTRHIPMTDFYTLPGKTPEVETSLAADELITAVYVPPLATATNSRYRKIRDRSSYAFALVSVAAALSTKDGVITDVRLSLGGVAPRPWRARQAETLLLGAPTTSFAEAAQAELAPAVTRPENAFKSKLTERAIVAVLSSLTD